MEGENSTFCRTIGEEELDVILKIRHPLAPEPNNRLDSHGEYHVCQILHRWIGED